MNCDNCGECCRWMLIGYKGDLPDDWCKARRIIKIHNDRTNRDYLAFPYPCSKWNAETKKCSIWPTRPKFCADYPPGCVECLIIRRLASELKRASQ